MRGVVRALRIGSRALAAPLARLDLLLTSRRVDRVPTPSSTASSQPGVRADEGALRHVGSRGSAMTLIGSSLGSSNAAGSSSSLGGAGAGAGTAHAHASVISLVVAPVLARMLGVHQDKQVRCPCPTQIATTFPI